LDEKIEKKVFGRFAEGALSKSKKMVPLPRALSTNLKNMVDLLRARTRALGNGAICMAKYPALPRASGLALGKELIQKKLITLARALLEALNKEVFKEKIKFLCRELGQVALGKSAVSLPTAVTATFLCRELGWALGKPFAESPMNSS